MLVLLFLFRVFFFFLVLFLSGFRVLPFKNRGYQLAAGIDVEDRGWPI